jgi:hypothetical protein
MGTVSKTLGQAMPGNSLVAIYTVPPGFSATANIIICNRGVFADTFRVAVAPGGESDDPKHYIAYDTVILANTTETISGLLLRAKDEVRVFASVTDISFTAMGIETG